MKAVLETIAVDSGHKNSHTPGRSVGSQTRHHIRLQDRVCFDVEKNLKGSRHLNSSFVKFDGLGDEQLSVVAALLDYLLATKLIRGHLGNSGCAKIHDSHVTLAHPRTMQLLAWI